MSNEVALGTLERITMIRHVQGNRDDYNLRTLFNFYGRTKNNISGEQLGSLYEEFFEGQSIRHRENVMFGGPIPVEYVGRLVLLEKSESVVDGDYHALSLVEISAEGKIVLCDPASVAPHIPLRIESYRK